MISRLSLTNWRAYESVELKLKPGTTFVVARNGIGKSSLIEGATWALFGDAGGRPTDAVRLGTSGASATVDVRLPDGRTLSVTRDLPKRLPKNRVAPVRVLLDGQVESGPLDETIRSAFGGEPSFLARLTMLRGREHLDPDASTLDLQAHLCGFFGIEGLQEALGELEGRAKGIDRRIREIKQITGVSPSQLSELRQRHEEAARNATESEALHRQALEASDIATRTKQEAEEYEAWNLREQTRLAALADVADQYRRFSGSSAAIEDLGNTLDSDEAALTAELDALRRRRASLEGRIDVIESAMGELDEAAGACPVCRRPLSEEDAAHARTAHRDELSNLRNELHSLDEDAVVARLDVIREHRRRVARLVAAEVSPTAPAVSIVEAAAQQAHTEAAAAAALTELVEQRSAAMTTATAIEGAEANQQAAELLGKEFGRLAMVTAAADAISSIINQLLEGTIEPLTREIGGRWKRLFSDRSPLAMTGQGIVSRDINGEQLPFASFSTGEKMGAQLLLRLMVLDAATRASFCWVDEPLEHLDPDARRQVASLLAATPTSTGVRQVLVTTYEEPLVRRLAERRPDEVDVVYVRSTGSR